MFSFRVIRTVRIEYDEVNAMLQSHVDTVTGLVSPSLRLADSA